MSERWNPDADTQVQGWHAPRPQHRAYRQERKPPPRDWARALKTSRELGLTVAAWLLVVILVLIILLTVRLVWHLGGPLNGGHP